jgi:hypothetical protein
MTIFLSYPKNRGLKGVLAFLNQFGVNKETWPSFVRDSLANL